MRGKIDVRLHKDSLGCLGHPQVEERRGSTVDFFFKFFFSSSEREMERLKHQ